PGQYVDKHGGCVCSGRDCQSGSCGQKGKAAFYSHEKLSVLLWFMQSHCTVVDTCVIGGELIANLYVTTLSPLQRCFPISSARVSNPSSAYNRIACALKAQTDSLMSWAPC